MEENELVSFGSICMVIIALTLTHIVLRDQSLTWCFAKMLWLIGILVFNVSQEVIAGIMVVKFKSIENKPLLKLLCSLSGLASFAALVVCVTWSLWHMEVNVTLPFPEVSQG